MDYKILIFPRAEKEISEAVFWYETQQERVGRKLIKSINDSLISRFNFREMPLNGFPYLIIYQVVDNQILFQSLFNTYQDPTKKP